MFDGAISITGVGDEWTYICFGETERLKSAAENSGATVVGNEGLSLDEIFVSRVVG